MAQEILQIAGAGAGGAADPVSIARSPACAPPEAPAAAALAAGASPVVLPKPGFLMPQECEIVLVGSDCAGGHWSCTRAVRHRGIHNGRFEPGLACTTIYPYNAVQPDPHLWLSVRVICSGTRCECEVHRIPELLNSVPAEYATVLVAVHRFVFGEGSPMCRLWLWWVATRERPCGPRQHIIDSVNAAIGKQPPAMACARLKTLTDECMKIPWPIQSYADALPT